MPTSLNDPIPVRRSWRRWPPEALEIVRQNKHPAAICEELASLTGKNKDACWLFMTRHGIQRPGSASRHSFDPRTCDAIIDYISDHGVQAAATRFGYEAKSLYNLLYRQEHTKLSRDALSLRQVCAHLRVKYGKASNWVEQGLLKASRHESRTGDCQLSDRIRRASEILQGASQSADHAPIISIKNSLPGGIRVCAQARRAAAHAREQTGG